ncbi:SPW repeat domain-containing protein [Methylobacterium gnaphalii]|uniref:SPW repeat-containing integral membrane domain-containing protein n=1 Tax=Methylobacterium gnaphalii TaxID=1010610 RepID=A0A512JJN8_9HYPH|nr:SPW repeat protein [Methylobacterium gnaphalii]GEP10174.1 hypothetical protein MGN01_20190 [Methylobacterium gnaphalii]GJD69518.1 hypothetical protein MMMDOFMJ_2449 [Methylobacterium gnaphalii]GLS48690.1 hypothetical protein GCM10007885_15340 [Methylobacterium gnaphalii]
MREDRKEQLAAFNLATGTLGMILIATPWAFDISEPTAVWSAVFSGALVMRLGFSTAMHFREWKARVEAAVAAWLLSVPWLLHWEKLSGVTWAHIVVGLAVAGAAAAGLRGRTADETPLDLGQCRGARPC